VRIRKIIAGLAAAALFNNFVYAQSPDEAENELGAFASAVDAAKVDLYGEHIGSLERRNLSGEALMAVVEQDLSLMAYCAAQRNILYSNLDELSLLADATRFKDHYGYYSQAVERHGLGVAKDLIDGYWGRKEAIKVEVEALYFKGLKNEDSPDYAKLYQFSEQCDVAAQAIEKIDAMALERANMN